MSGQKGGEPACAASGPPSGAKAAEKALSLLGLCKKAGLLVTGFDEVAAAMRGGQKGKSRANRTVHLVALAADLSPKSVKETERIARNNNIPTIRLGATLDEVWRAVGRRSGILAVTEEGLAGKISRAARQNEEEEFV